MAKYQFRLEALLKLRASARDERREQLAEAFHAESILKEQIEGTLAKIAVVKDQSREASIGKLNIDGLLQNRSYQLVLQTEVKMLEDRKTLIAEEIVRRQLALAESDKQVRVMEKLKEKRKEEHRFHEEQVENRRIDEIAQRNNRRRVIEK